MGLEPGESIPRSEFLPGHRPTSSIQLSAFEFNRINAERNEMNKQITEKNALIQQLKKAREDEVNELKKQLEEAKERKEIEKEEFEMIVRQQCVQVYSL